MDTVQEYIETIYSEFQPSPKGILHEKTICTFLKNVFSQIKTAEKSWKSNSKKIMKSMTSSSTMENKSSIETPDYLDNELRTQIVNHCKSIHQFKNVLLGERTYTIDFVLEREFQSMGKSDKRYIEEKMRYVYCWLYVLQKHAPIRNKGASPPGGEAAICSNTVHIHLYLTSLKKVSPESCGDIHIGQKHVNTAITTGCQPSTHVHVFRLEEWFKVLIHESCHNTGLDFIDIGRENENIANSTVKTKFPVNVQDIRLYETWSEMWGEILYNMFYIVLSPVKKSPITKRRQYKMSGGCVCGMMHGGNRDKIGKNQNVSKSLKFQSRKKMSTMLKELEYRLSRESIFSSLQANKILKHHKMTYQDLSSSPEKASQYTESTQCFCYYILKGILMIHFNRFLLFSVQQQPNSESPIDFRLTRENLDTYVQTILNLADHETTITYMSKAREILDSNPTDEPFKSTLRMSLYNI